MNAIKAEAVVTMSAAVVFGSVTTGKIVLEHKPPTGRQIAATCLAFAALGTVAMLAPDLGAGLALATAGTAFVTYGLPVLATFYPDQKGK